jgi:hypothetical protein
MKINLRNMMLSFQEALKNSAPNFVPIVNLGLKFCIQMALQELDISAATSILAASHLLSTFYQFNTKHYLLKIQAPSSHRGSVK